MASRSTHLEFAAYSVHAKQYKHQSSPSAPIRLAAWWHVSRSMHVYAGCNSIVFPHSSLEIACRPLCANVSPHSCHLREVSPRVQHCIRQPYSSLGIACRRLCANVSSADVTYAKFHQWFNIVFVDHIHCLKFHADLFAPMSHPHSSLARSLTKGSTLYSSITNVPCTFVVIHSPHYVRVRICTPTHVGTRSGWLHVDGFILNRDELDS